MVETLDLEQDPKTLLAQIERLAETLRCRCPASSSLTGGYVPTVAA